MVSGYMRLPRRQGMADIQIAKFPKLENRLPILPSGLARWKERRSLKFEQKIKECNGSSDGSSCWVGCTVTSRCCLLVAWPEAVLSVKAMAASMIVAIVSAHWFRQCVAIPQLLVRFRPAPLKQTDPVSPYVSATVACPHSW